MRPQTSCFHFILQRAQIRAITEQFILKKLKPNNLAMAQALLARCSLPNSRTAQSCAGALPRGTLILASSFTGNSCSAFNVRVQRKKADCRAISSSIRCEQSAKESQKGTDVWLGRLAMIGFATAISVEVSTGRGLLENFGLTTPQPILALFVTGLVVGLTAFFILQSSSRD